MEMWKLEEKKAEVAKHSVVGSQLSGSGSWPSADEWPESSLLLQDIGTGVSERAESATGLLLEREEEDGEKVMGV